MWHSVGTIVLAASTVQAPPIAAISWDIAHASCLHRQCGRAYEDKGMMMEEEDEDEEEDEE